MPHVDNGQKVAQLFVPLFLQTQKKLSNSNCNFSLYSPRMVAWKFTGKKIEKDEEAISKLYKQSKLSFSAVKRILELKNKRQKDYISSLQDLDIKAFSFRAETTSPFITGLGSGHPTETGMILDRNIGIPYIPASSVKGVLRLACAINLAREIPEYAKTGIVPDGDKTLVKYFGMMTQDENKQRRGQLVFLDAYPEKAPSLKLDILNPHFSEYYSGENNKQPVETESPVPVKFLTVKEGTVFTFNCAFMPLENETCTRLR